MLISKDKSKEKDEAKPAIHLATDWPLCEKDEQAIAIEHTKILQKEALDRWERLRKKRH